MDIAPYHRGTQRSLRTTFRNTCPLYKKHFHYKNHGLLDSDHAIDIHRVCHSIQTQNRPPLHLHDRPWSSNIWCIDNLHLHRLHRRREIHLTGHLRSDDTSITLTIYRFGRQALASLFGSVELLAWLCRRTITGLSIQGLQLALHAFYNRRLDRAD